MMHDAHFIGQAGEYLVAAEITSKGHVCLTTPPKVKYDLVADVNDKLLRIQVKTINLPKKSKKGNKLVYEFSLKKNRKKEGSFYLEDDIDGFALVVWSKKLISFIPLMEGSSISFRIPGLNYGSQRSSGKYMDDVEYTFESFLEKLGVGV